MLGRSLLIESSSVAGNQVRHKTLGKLDFGPLVSMAQLSGVLVDIYFQSVRDIWGKKNLQTITKTCLCNFDPLKPHFYIVKLGVTGIYIIFVFISAQKHRL